MKAARVFVLGMALLSLAALAMLALRLLRPRAGRRLAQEVVGTRAGRALLDLLGVRLVVHREGPWPPGPCFYMANHASSLDLPVLMALGLPDARTFIKERYRWYGPLGVVLACTGALYTAPQDQPARRVARFIEATERLRRGGESAFGSPEGTRVTGGRVGPFNRGVFHVAMALEMPIVPLLIVTPPEVDPGRGLAAGAGEVHVHVGEPLPTRGWRPEDLDAHKDALRARFLAWQAELAP